MSQNKRNVTTDKRNCHKMCQHTVSLTMLRNNSHQTEHLLLSNTGMKQEAIKNIIHSTKCFTEENGVVYLNHQT